MFCLFLCREPEPNARTKGGGGSNMPREGRVMADVLQAVEENNFTEVKTAFESTLKRRKEKSSPFNLFCLGEHDKTLQKDLDCAILAAAKLQDTKILRFMMKNGANVNFLSQVATTIPPPSANPFKTSPLHMAVKNGLYDTMALLLENNANVNIQDHKKRSPLHIAAANADCVATRMLLCRGANVHVTDHNGQTVLQMASKMGHVELVRILLDNNAQIFHEGQKGPSPLHIAGIHGHVPVIDMFSRYVDVNIRLACDPVDGKKEKAVIHLAAERGLVETVRFLLDRFGADVNTLDSDDQTALHCALLAKHDHTRMRPKQDFEMLVDLLLKKGVRVNQQNRKGETALHLAAKNQFHRIADMLHLGSTDARLKNLKQQTAFEVIPEFDLPMKQIFARSTALSSPYIAHLPMTITHPCSPSSPVVEMEKMSINPSTNPLPSFNIQVCNTNAGVPNGSMNS